MLRANLEFVNLDRGARSIMVTSALEKEGKSTTVANLAVALARAGQKVALVDLDLRRPAIASFFGIPYSDPGMTNIVVGSSTLEAALVEVSRTPMAAADASHVDGNGVGSNGSGGVLKVLTSGRIPPNPGELVKAKRLTAALEQLARSFDFVLIDTPPLLSVGDAMALSAHVDAMITVARLRMLRRASPRRACPDARDLRDDQARCRRHGGRSGAGVRLRPQLRIPPHVEADGGMGAPSSRELVTHH